MTRNVAIPFTKSRYPFRAFVCKTFLLSFPSKQKGSPLSFFKNFCNQIRKDKAHDDIHQDCQPAHRNRKDIEKQALQDIDLKRILSKFINDFTFANTLKQLYHAYRKCSSAKSNKQGESYVHPGYKYRMTENLFSSTVYHRTVSTPERCKDTPDNSCNRKGNLQRLPQAIHMLVGNMACKIIDAVPAEQPESQNRAGRICRQLCKNNDDKYCQHKRGIQRDSVLPPPFLR